jgi:hypothetical protein
MPDVHQPPRQPAQPSTVTKASLVVPWQNPVVITGSPPGQPGQAACHTSQYIHHLRATADAAAVIGTALPVPPAQPATEQGSRQCPGKHSIRAIFAVFPQNPHMRLPQLGHAGHTAATASMPHHQQRRSCPCAQASAAASALGSTHACMWPPALQRQATCAACTRQPLH